ncbi:protein phosphatase Slingshot homolog 2 isoform X2 [Astatotilapia calliptera]|uniref:protein-serine/threonine phosphatase n=1 Tax=Astatotilapia calliptera TaxID=8154 RepID=A0A3P8P9W2_ASTCA|nr:protein phosphatase Slingshot homolog 2 isoform X2 [Astatotilapia calliptera]
MALVTVQRSPTPSTTSSPCVSESGSGEDDRRFHLRSISESFLTVKGAALFLPRGNSPTQNSAPRISQRRNKHTGDLQKHLQTMFTVLRPEDTIRLAVRLESACPQVTRYMVVVSTNGRQDIEESIVLGMDFVSSDSCCTVGLVLPLWSDTMIHLDGDGGFSVSTVNRVHVFKPVSVQAMWSALQSLHKACEVARCHNYYPGSLFLTWVSYYQSRVSSSQLCINEWNAMQDVESHRANSPVLFTDLPTERERTERLIKTRLREIMMQKDLENVTSKEIRTELEIQMVCNLREFKEFIDNEMIVILGQMDSPTEIFDHVFLGSEWNASNLEELQNSGVRYILNVTREIDNFFPGMFEYHNIRVYDEEATNLLEYWNDTYKFITKAKKAGAKCLVHCKMGVSRSASTVIAYAMKEYGWNLDTAFDYVKERRAVTKPNPSFMKQLEEYQGILLASKQRHNKLWRSHSDSDLSDRLDSKPSSPSLNRADSHNNNTSSPSVHHFLGVAVLQALYPEPEDSHALSNGVCDSLVQEVRSDCADPRLLPLPRPRAATVVPEEKQGSSASVAITVPVALPLPPPSLHILPPTPELQRAHRDTPTHLSCSVGKPEELFLILPDRSSSEEVSPLTLGSTDSDMINQSLSDLTNNSHTPLSPATPTSSPPISAFAPSDDNNNNPSELDTRGEADGSSTHSTDSIDFFSAREKFLGLAKDGRHRTLSEQAQQRTSLSTDRETEVSEDEEEQRNEMSQESDDSSDKTSPDRIHHTHHDNGISVRHIVTEIEAISHPAASLQTPSSSSSSPLPPSSHSPQVIRPEHQEEGESSEVTHTSSTPPSHPQPPTTLLCDWPAGSVRRATKQLEQKLKQELEMVACQRSPLHSPSSEQPPVILSVSSEHVLLHSPMHAAEQRITQGENMAVSANATSKDEEKHTGSHKRPDFSGTSDLQDLSCSPKSDISHVSGAIPVSAHTSTDSHTVTSSLASAEQLSASSQDTSAQSLGRGQLHSQNLQDCSNLMTLDGVTLQESDTDESSRVRQEGCGPVCAAQKRLARGSQELEKIQQTLRELQAFLHEGITLETADSRGQELGQPQGPRDAMDTDPESYKGVSFEESPPALKVGQQLLEKQEQRSLLEPTEWHRATELEARIRQAGLTPPSLMKRSASLAKLDCLELSAHDLSSLDLRTHNRATLSHSPDSPSSPQSHPDDTWKKQKVLAQRPCSERTGSCSDDTSPPPLGLSPSTRGERGEREESENSSSSNSTVPASRQPGRGHSSRRSRKASAEKKQQRAVTLLYNTM